MNDMSTKIDTTIISRNQNLRFVTAASLFDGHDASINIIRRILQSNGCEVIHLGHNRSVEEIVDAAVQEDADGIAVSSYQGGHVEYFKYMIDLLKEKTHDKIKLFGGGGGVIVESELNELHNYGVEKIYTPEDGAKLGLEGIILDMIDRTKREIKNFRTEDIDILKNGNHFALSRLITALESNSISLDLENIHTNGSCKILGITGTGGAGKSSLTDELILRFSSTLNDEDKIVIIAIDPSKRKTGGALLGDRIRMNSINKKNIFFRSLATKSGGTEIVHYLPQVISAAKVFGARLVIVETSGIGQGDAAIVDHVDKSLYVMTPEFGAASQLEKIDMLDFADYIAINKFDRAGSLDALRDVRKQVQRAQLKFDQSLESMQVFPTIASRFNDVGVTNLQLAISNELFNENFAKETFSSNVSSIIPGERKRYLAEISETVRNYHKHVEEQCILADKIYCLEKTEAMLDSDLTSEISKIKDSLSEKINTEYLKKINNWNEKISSLIKQTDDELYYESLSGTRIPKIAHPKYSSYADILKWQLKENFPGEFPFTSGVFPLKRENEDPTRMFAGEGDAFKTNSRFKMLSSDMPAKRLSTAFDSVTLYGFDPDTRPDIYGKIGNSGVSIATLDDMEVLYSGFDLCDPKTSVSMTINGPAPTILAMFMNTAINQKIAKFEKENSKKPSDSELQSIKSETMKTVRGTVQADILKEDQGQNTCIFSTEFSLKVMGDIQQYFINNDVRFFYSVSISGYHIAEAGANPITQLAFTLANGFTYVESYLARGMKIDDFAQNFSFFFSNGMDPEYTVIGRVARRIWAVVMREKYGAGERAQKLKYHCQTSGRSLHAQEITFNDIRTTLQALIATYDNANSLHTNAFDEAITTPTEKSVRQALAIQMIINKEWGLAKNQNPNQGSFIIDQLTDLVEERVLQEFERLSQRGGVLGAMETGYQRGKIQDESLHYEIKKHDGSYPIIGVNTFTAKEDNDQESVEIELARSTDEEKKKQIKRLNEFKEKNKKVSKQALENLRKVVINNGNVFEELMTTVKYCSLGEITHTLFQVGGKYRRSM